MTEFMAGLQNLGIYAMGHPWFLSLAHTEGDIDHTIAVAADAVDEAFAMLKEIAADKRDPLPYI